MLKRSVPILFEKRYMESSAVDPSFPSAPHGVPFAEKAAVSSSSAGAGGIGPS